MSSSRGDRKPCMEAACVGTMQFRREPQPAAAVAALVERDWGWSCDFNPGHFRRDPPHFPSTRIADARADAAWDDDGAPPAGAQHRR